MVGFYIAAIACLVFAFFSAYWAAWFVAHGKAPQDEFIARQFTAGAWVFGIATVCLPVAADLLATPDPVETPLTGFVLSTPGAVPPSVPLPLEVGK